MQSTTRISKFIRIIELKIIIEGRIYIIILDIYLKSGNIPIIWKKFIVKVVNDRENLYNRPDGLLQHCFEKHLCNFHKITTFFCIINGDRI